MTQFCACMKRSLGILFLLIPVNVLFAQQAIIGVVKENFTEKPLENVHVNLLAGETRIAQTTTNEKGRFMFEHVAVGHYELAFSHLSFIPFTQPGVEVNAAYPTHIEAKMDLSMVDLKEITIFPPKERGTSSNRMALLSSYSIDAVDARKLAGSLDDPARVAGLLPGVASYKGFSANFISIRGNSPRGFKYYLEGVELPNPTHFARIGSSGGTFTIFSMHLMGKSDFFSGAFPAEYGDATAGVMDVRFREGGTNDHQYMMKLGTLGIDLASEGPLNRKKSSSYVANYRYAVVGLGRLFGLATQPVYQDISFNLNLPLSSKSKLKVFGIAGMSDRERPSVSDPLNWTEDLDRYRLNLGSKMATIGSNYSLRASENSVFGMTMMAGVSEQYDNKHYIFDDLVMRARQINETASVPISFTTSLKHKFGKHHSNKTGVALNAAWHDWQALKYNMATDVLDTLVTGSGHSVTTKAYTSSTFNLTYRWKVNIGVNWLYHSVNKKQAIEPRAGISFLINDNNKISFAYGRHSQAEHFATYRFQFTDSTGKITFPNRNLDFIRSDHFILGWKSRLFSNHRLVLEVYYQQLMNVPVEPGGTFSTINLKELDELRALENTGSGRNFGIDVGLERFEENGLYYMLNGSLFRSYYTAGDRVERPSTFDLGYISRFLLGKEYSIGKDKQNFLGWNTNFSVMGGQAYTPIDLDASRAALETIYNESAAYSEREDALLFLDLTVTFRKNKKSSSTLWSLQLKNLFANGNALYREYDSVTDKEVTIPSTGFFPNISYKISF